MNFRERDLHSEVMDGPLDHELHEAALEGLSRINQFTRVAEKNWPLIKSLAEKNQKPLRILDIATGGGDFPIRIKLKSQEEKIPLLVQGCDMSDVALGFARRKAESQNAAVTFFKLNILENSIPDYFDVLTFNLFFHHLSKENVLSLMRNIHKTRSRLIIVNDLERSFWGFVAAFIGTRFLSHSNVVHQDGTQSVRNALSKSEFEELAKAANWRDVEIKRTWPFRIQMIWKRL